METTISSSIEVPIKKFHADNDELELGLGLSLAGAGAGARVKFLTAQDLPASMGCRGSKRDAFDQASSSPPLSSQVVGWPPVGSYRINNLSNQPKASTHEDEKMNNGGENNAKEAPLMQESRNLGFVKVNMDGVQIGRKLDLSVHASYESLAHAIEDMFFRPSLASVNSISGEKDQQGKPSKLLDGSSEFVLTYEDKEGDWMLVGDIPFRMFLDTVKRLRILRTSEASGVAPRSQERNHKHRSNTHMK